jgi:hypothetical protein
MPTNDLLGNTCDVNETDDDFITDTNFFWFPYCNDAWKKPARDEMIAKIHKRGQIGKVSGYYVYIAKMHTTGTLGSKDLPPDVVRQVNGYRYHKSPPFTELADKAIRQLYNYSGDWSEYWRLNDTID